MITETITPSKLKKSEFKELTMLKSMTPTLVKSRLCRRLTEKAERRPLDPQEDLGFKLDFQKIAEKNSLHSEFLESGLDLEHPKVKLYNTMHYCKNSPYALETKILGFDQISTRINLSTS